MKKMSMMDGDGVLWDKGAEKDRPERHFEHHISQKAAAAAVAASHGHVADGATERHTRLEREHNQRELEARQHGAHTHLNATGAGSSQEHACMSSETKIDRTTLTLPSTWGGAVWPSRREWASQRSERTSGRAHGKGREREGGGLAG